MQILNKKIIELCTKHESSESELRELKLESTALKKDKLASEEQKRLAYGKYQSLAQEKIELQQLLETKEMEEAKFRETHKEVDTERLKLIEERNELQDNFCNEKEEKSKINAKLVLLEKELLHIKENESKIINSNKELEEKFFHLCYL